MSYQKTWNTIFESIPDDDHQISEGASRIRDLKLAVRERMQKDHYFPPTGTDGDHGEHVKVTLRKQASAPTMASDKGFLYTKQVGIITELFYKDSAGNEVQITSEGVLNTGA